MIYIKIYQNISPNIRIIENVRKKSEYFFFKAFPDVFSVVWSRQDRVSGHSGPKNIEKKLEQKVFFRPKEATGPARTGKKKSKKIEKFWPDELPARQPASGTGPG